MQIKLQELVKSRDFPGIANCYYVGCVTSIDKTAGTFTAATLFRVFDGEKIKTNVAKQFTAPLPGAGLLDEIDPARITRYANYQQIFQEIAELQ